MGIILDRIEEMQEQERINRAEDSVMRDINAVITSTGIQVRAKDEIAEFCYCQIRDSPLWDDATLNSVIDTKAEELAELIEQTLNEWFRKQSPVSFPVEGTRLVSLSEAQEGREA